MLGESLEQFLRPGVRLAVRYGLRDGETDEIILMDDENNVAVTITSDVPLCWETSRRNNVVKFPG